MRRIQVLLVIITVAFLVLSAGWAFAGDGKAQGQPFQTLQQQIDDLKAQIAAIQLTPGPAGANGIHCWDSNQNGACDLLTEDINADGKCDVNDCQAPLSNRTIQVYDSSEPPQYLGIGVNIYSEIFVPGLSLGTRISADGDIDANINLFWETDDCNGDVFIDFLGTNLVFKMGEEYYSARKVAPTICTALSYRNYGNPDSICYKFMNPWSVNAIPIEKIPKEAIPFTLPVVLPLQHVLE